MHESEIEVVPNGEGVTIHLPQRELGGFKKAGWLIVGISSIGTLFMIFWISMPVSWGVDLLRQGQMFGWLFVAFGSLGLGGLYASAKFLALGISVLRDKTRCSVTVSDKRIVSQEKFGWFGWKQKIKRSEVDQIFVLPIGSIGSSREEPSGSGLGFLESIFDGDTSNFYAITNQKRDGQMIAPGYPKEIVDSVATTIAGELNRNSAGSVLINRDPVARSSDDSPSTSIVTVQNLTEEEVEQADFTLPPDSQLEIIEEGDSKVYRIPERTLLRGSSGLFFFAIIWNGFMAVFTAAVIFGAKENELDLAFIAFTVVFWSIGIGMLVGSFYMARQSALVGVKDGLLFIERKTIFGTKWTEFAADQVESIEMDSTNMQVNDVPVMNLKIQPLEGDAVGMFSHLDNEEIQWLAQQLRRSLGLSSNLNRFAVGNFDPSKPLEHLPSTDIQVQQDNGRTAITVPPHRFRGSRMLGFLGLLFMVVPFPALIAGIWFWGFELFFLIFTMVFSGMGAIIFFAHRISTTRNYQIVATSQKLDVTVNGFMPNQGLSATRPEILSVDVFDSGTQLNGKMLLCLKIKVKDKRGLTMMTGRDSKELVYVARLIRQRIQLVDKPDDSDSKT